MWESRRVSGLRETSRRGFAKGLSKRRFLLLLDPGISITPPNERNGILSYQLAKLADACRSICPPMRSARTSLINLS